MARQKATASQQTIAFPADWEWCAAKETHRPRWQPLGSTPGAIKLSPSRSYRVSARPETTAANLADMLRVAPGQYVRTIRVPRGGAISAAGLGDAVAKFGAVETVALSWPNRSAGWIVGLVQEQGRGVQIDLEGWPVDEVTAALGRVARARRLDVRLQGYEKGFSLKPMFQLKGLELVHVEHRDHCEQELGWDGLSGQDALRSLEVRAGFLAEGLWREVGKLKRLQSLELWWPRKAKAMPGSLSGLASLRKVHGVCLFEPVPDAFAALAECPKLEEVRIDQATLDNTSAAGIGALRGVKDSNIWNATLSDAGVKALCRWPRIKSLVLAEDSSNPTPITEDGFVALGGLKTLESLHLQGFEKVAPEGWAVLRRLKRLKGLKLSCSPPFDLLVAIGPLPSVERLALSHCNSVGPAGYGLLKGMPRLRSLSVSVHQYSPYHIPLEEVSEARQLTSLALAGLHKMSDDHLAKLAALEGLEELALHETSRITERGIAGLAGLRNLRLVSLHTLPKMAGQAVATLAAFPRLETLFLHCNSKITDKDLEALASARGLKVLHLDNARNLTGECLLRLAAALPLEELSVNSSPHLADEHILKLAESTTLKRVEIRACKNVTEGGRNALAALRPDWQSPTFQQWVW